MARLLTRSESNMPVHLGGALSHQDTAVSGAVQLLAVTMTSLGFSRVTITETFQ